MAEPRSGDLAAEFTGLCTYLVQGPPFEAGDEVEVLFAREPALTATSSWLPINATDPAASRETLSAGERDLGTAVALVRARLARTGGVPRDSMNRPCDEYDPEALTLSDVRVLDRRPSPEESATSDGRES